MRWLSPSPHLAMENWILICFRWLVGALLTEAQAKHTWRTGQCHARYQSVASTRVRNDITDSPKVQAHHWEKYYSNLWLSLFIYRTVCIWTSPHLIPFGHSHHVFTALSTKKPFYPHSILISVVIIYQFRQPFSQLLSLASFFLSYLVPLFISSVFFNSLRFFSFSFYLSFLTS
jgi:hypothetical protein